MKPIFYFCSVIALFFSVHSMADEPAIEKTQIHLVNAMGEEAVEAEVGDYVRLSFDSPKKDRAKGFKYVSGISLDGFDLIDQTMKVDGYWQNAGAPNQGPYMQTTTFVYYLKAKRPGDFTIKTYVTANKDDEGKPIKGFNPVKKYEQWVIVKRKER